MARQLKKTSRKGRPLSPNQSEVINPYALQRRIDLVGVHHAHDPRAGSMLGCYLLRGHINERQYQAGEALTRLWLRWRHMAHVRDGFARRSSGAATHSDIPHREWLKIKDRMTSLYPIIAGKRDLVSLVIYGMWIEPSPAFLSKLTKALDQVADVFRLRVLPTV